MDCEIIQQIQRYMDPEIHSTDPDSIAISAIKEVGSAGHFFGVEHTQSRYESAFYQPFLSDWKNYEAWEAAGAVWTPQRAYKIYEQILHEFSEPTIDQEVDEELKDFVARRKTEGGAPTDF